MFTAWLLVMITMMMEVRISRGVVYACSRATSGKSVGESTLTGSSFSGEMSCDEPSFSVKQCETKWNTPSAMAIGLNRGIKGGLKKVNMMKSGLQKVKFIDSGLQKVKFIESGLQKMKLIDSHIQKPRLMKARIL
jgi:hypothetical protein